MRGVTKKVTAYIAVDERLRKDVLNEKVMRRLLYLSDHWFCLKNKVEGSSVVVVGGR